MPGETMTGSSGMSLAGAYRLCPGFRLVETSISFVRSSSPSIAHFLRGRAMSPA